MIGKAVFASLDLGRHDVLKDEYQIKTDSTQPICSKPQDIILITLMDLWLDNRDRKVTNSNLLLNFSDDFMYVFDHYDCFGGTRQIGNINVKSMIQSNGMFIESNLGQYFLKLTSKSQFDIIVDKFILDTANNALLLQVLKQIQSIIPKQWLLSSNLFDQLELFLLHNERKEIVIEHVKQRFRRYCI